MLRTTDEARRLARAIVQDLLLYGGKPALEDTRALTEARALFASRAEPSLLPLLEEELEAARHQPSAAGAHRPSEPRPVGESAGGVVAAGGLLLLVVLLAGAAYLLLAR